jgi:hypothetical protein
MYPQTERNRPTDILWIKRICFNTVLFPLSPAPKSSILISLRRITLSRFNWDSISSLPMDDMIILVRGEHGTGTRCAFDLRALALESA